MNVFQDKDTFLSHFKDRLRKKYLVTPKTASPRHAYQVLAELVSDYTSEAWYENLQAEQEHPEKEVHYFSMEFLMGRLITNNLYNLGVRDVVLEAFSEIGLDLDAVEHQEVDAGLGNGGLGRLAACFMDSIASLSYKGHGNGIRYRYGFFEQTLKNGYQVEKPDDWLKDRYHWEVRKEEESLDIPFGGSVEEQDGEIVYKPDELIRAVPYDVPIIGEGNGVVNRLRLWNAEPTDLYPRDIHAFDYNEEIRNISAFLYPDDTTDEGKILRIKQQYFFSAAGVRSLMHKHYENYGTLENFADKKVFQINDTHPALVIPEMMRLMVDEYRMEWDKAWEITQKTCAYTNHTILAEALEKWPIHLIQPTLPRVYSIIEEINRRYVRHLRNHFAHDENKIQELAIIHSGEVRMAHLAIVGSFSVNGVAELHTNILIHHEMRDFYELYPKKFNSKTNGITHRRFLKHINPGLRNLLKEHAPAWLEDPDRLKDFERVQDDADIQRRVMEIKRENKVALSKRIEREQGIRLDPDSVFDVQVKRMHEYKRQLMNALHIMMVYNRLKTDEEFKKGYVPHSFIFGAKAAGAYHYAKKIIKLINTIAKKVNNDADTNEHLKVVFVENYNVTYAEQIIPACDISEQISTASKEASGTGNMKFMMNGALTLGTLDGANVEIAERAGRENCEIFGIDADEVTRLNREGGYNPREIYDNDEEIRTVVDQLTNGFFEDVPKNEFEEIRNKLLNEDGFYVLKDLRGYSDAHKNANERFKDKKGWARMAIANIANSGFFSSDRTIEDYVRDIWKLPRFSLEKK